jgi:hypothetical protein
MQNSVDHPALLADLAVKLNYIITNAPENVTDELVEKILTVYKEVVLNDVSDEDVALGLTKPKTDED